MLAPALERVTRWIEGRNRPRGGELRLGRRNVYVLPSRPGMLYALVLLTMLVASINYALSLGYMLTFLLGAVAIVAMLHAFRNLHALVLRPGRSEPVFAGQPAEFSLELINTERRERLAIRLAVPGMARHEVADLAPDSEQLVRIAVPTQRRGWLPVPRITVWTTYPLGLWRVWAWWQPTMKTLVYPTPETPAVPLPEHGVLAADGSGSGGSEDDVAAVRPYQPSDSPRRIAWKAMARTGADTLLTKQFDGGERGELLLDWHQLPPQLDAEAKISRLTRWVLDAESAGARWALVLPGRRFELDGGAEHRTRCLEALATLEA